MSATVVQVTQQEHIVYRLFADDGSLLYVGMTGQLLRRLGEHAGTRPWWDLVASISLERYPDRISAAQAEAAAIRREDPEKNLVRMKGNTRTRSFRVSDALWEAASARAATEGLTMTEVLHEALVNWVKEREGK